MLVWQECLTHNKSATDCAAMSGTQICAPPRFLLQVYWYRCSLSVPLKRKRKPAIRCTNETTILSSGVPLSESDLARYRGNRPKTWSFLGKNITPRNRGAKTRWARWSYSSSLTVIPARALQWSYNPQDSPSSTQLHCESRSKQKPPREQKRLMGNPG